MNWHPGMQYGLGTRCWDYGTGHTVPMNTMDALLTEGSIGAVDS
jgi:hypothetical protein